MKRIGVLLLGFLFCFAVAAWPQAQPQIITINVPGAGTSAGQGTVPQCINPAGAITGYYLDANNVFHGFLRTPDGWITTFDAPGADLTPNNYNGTFAYSINPAGAITGNYVDSSNLNHGFVRAPDGTITEFDVPGAGTGAYQGTVGENINPAGMISGDYLDGSNVYHGFLRTPDGWITTFEAPGAGTGAYQGTGPGDVQCLNPAGATTGGYIDAEDVWHAFIRAPNGKFTTYEAPGAAGTFFGSINPSAATSGYYWESNNLGHALLRAPDGTITQFDVPGAGTGAYQGTWATNLNPSMAITGYYVDSGNLNHGFVRAPDGWITTFEAPGAGTGANQGTIPYCNNPAGEITGWYVDGSNVYHGFLRLP